MRLPRPRGPLSSHLVTVLREPVRRDRALDGLAATAVGTAESVLADEDVQLGLLILQELSHDGLDGVDDGWERSPDVVSARAILEDAVEAELRAEVAQSVHRVMAEARRDPAAAIFALTDDAEGPSLAGHLQRLATRRELDEFLVHRSILQLREADGHTWLIPRLSGKPKAALVEVQSDEYGGGRLERMHAHMYADTLLAAGLDPEYGHYLDQVPATTLALHTTARMFGQQRRLRGATAGHLAGVEATSSLPNRRVAAAVRRLGLGDRAAAYFDEHVVADAVHEQVVVRDLCGGLVEQEPALLEDVVFGVLSCLLLDARMATAVLDAWDAKSSSLLAEQPDRLGAVG